VKLERSCGAVIFRRKGDRLFFLLLKHASGRHWGLAKGHAEEGETELETALREVLEETGLTVEILDGFIQKNTYSPRVGVSKEVTYFLGEALKKKLKLQAGEIIHGVWLELEDCMRLCSHAATKTVLIAAHHFLNHKTLPIEL